MKGLMVRFVREDEGQDLIECRAARVVPERGGGGRRDLGRRGARMTGTRPSKAKSRK